MDNELIKRLDYISEQSNRYFGILIFIFGFVGNILNCFILSQRTFRFNPCGLLFLISSFIDLISILIGLITRILAGWQLDPTSRIDWICKFRAFTVFSTRTMSIWLITLAVIDRWFLSSMDLHRRQMSSLKNVYRGIILTSILSTLSYIHMIYCYQSNIIDAPLQCYGKNNICRLITDLVYALITIVIPSILMIIFTMMIISNIRALRLRIQTVTILSITIPSREKQIKYKRTDHQLLRMLLVQVILLVIFCVPQAIQKIYISFKPFASVSKEEDALNHFLYNIEVLMAFIASGMPFYLYTLCGGTVFRRASTHFIKTIQKKIKCFS
ncbi:unnamed protein product [Adineta steineri]|uniref:G-protein coupled receptors family 1 profile domain-containing protein n=1 Tax=Adineta steineri TaxID=433720 RepID=A0A815MEI4_9BILA|nr:unnamed protein product [Adineta steineri]CAF1421851.1 unnamed protein product [Adineta steineri]